MIDVIALTKVYQDGNMGRQVAVDRVHFHVRSGEIFGLLGANGAGKTTLLRILATMLRPTSGTVRIAGYDVREFAAEVRQRIGFVSNNTAIYDRMTAEETLCFFGKLNGLTGERLRQRTESLIDTLRMNDFRKQPGAKLSTGMKQKVSIARALIHDPPVLIFDEATLGLDVMVARNLLQVIRQLKNAGKCIIFSTHIMSEVEKLCDRIAIMHRGRVLDSGTLVELKSRHDQNDVEELFFSLVTAHDQTATEPSVLQGAG
jgi:sodium transport system ATP-binding protein